MKEFLTALVFFALLAALAISAATLADSFWGFVAYGLVGLCIFSLFLGDE